MINKQTLIQTSLELADVISYRKNLEAELNGPLQELNRLQLMENQLVDKYRAVLKEIHADEVTDADEEAV